ncbi:MAG: glycosyltransferase [Burkholderiales bacterium]
MLRRLLNKILAKSRQRDLSIIICSIDDQNFNCVAENYARQLGDWPYELIRIDDATSLADGYNRGIERSNGELLIFSHDDIEILTPDFCDRLFAHLESFDLIGVAGTSMLLNGRWISAGQPGIHGQVVQPVLTGEGFTLDVFGPENQPARGNIQALDGLFLATRRWVAESLRFDAENFDGFHLYDIDFSYRAHLAGLRVGVCNDILIYHQSLGPTDDTWERYMKVFWNKFAGNLSVDPPGVQKLYVRERVRTKSEALALFQQYLGQRGIVKFSR